MEADLKARGLAYQKEVPFKIQTGEGVEVSGRCDYLLDDEVVEVKSTTNRRRISDAANGRPKVEHLAQLALYLGHFRKEKGRLIYNYFEEDEQGELVIQTQVTVYVTVEEDEVYVNGKVTGHRASDLVDFVVGLSGYLERDELPPRAVNATSSFGPCNYCPLKEICGATIDSEKARELIASQEPYPFSINKVKEKKDDNASVSIAKEARSKPRGIRKSPGKKPKE